MKHCLIAIIFFLPLCPAKGNPEQTNSPANAPLSLQNYLAELDRWSAAAGDLKEHPEHAEALRKSLPDAWQVDVRGQHFAVPTAWLRMTLDSLKANHWLAGDYSLEIQKHLAMMRAEAEAFGQPAAISPGSARARLDDILRQREFATVQGPTWFEQLQARVQNWILDFLKKIFGGLGRHPMAGNILLWLAVGAAVVLSVLLLVRFLVSTRERESLKLEAVGPASPTWKEWGRDALAAAGRGDYREAIRLAYWAGIFRMEELGAWQADRARTHREYLRLLAADDAHRAPLARVTSQFELTWYGGNPASAQDFESVIEQLEALGCNLGWRPATANS
ncbi:MAG TPA: DUF4129 domain-containing protein [Terriglobia bacterium]|nr:DUF4129 domain-containing protein [Terriglobia bacterium]